MLFLNIYFFNMLPTCQQKQKTDKKGQCLKIVFFFPLGIIYIISTLYYHKPVFVLEMCLIFGRRDLGDGLAENRSCCGLQPQGRWPGRALGPPGGLLPVTGQLPPSCKASTFNKLGNCCSSRRLTRVSQCPLLPCQGLPGLPTHHPCLWQGLSSPQEADMASGKTPNL